MSSVDWDCGDNWEALDSSLDLILEIKSWSLLLDSQSVRVVVVVVEMVIAVEKSADEIQDVLLIKLIERDTWEELLWVLLGICLANTLIRVFKKELAINELFKKRNLFLITCTLLQCNKDTEQNTKYRDVHECKVNYYDIANIMIHKHLHSNGMSLSASSKVQYGIILITQ